MVSKLVTSRLLYIKPSLGKQTTLVCDNKLSLIPTVEQEMRTSGNALQLVYDSFQLWINCSNK